MWKMETVFCAFCKLPHKVFSRKHVDWTNILLSVGGSFAVSFVVWQVFDHRVLYLSVFFVVLSEIFVQMRWRISVNCTHCGFDPILYMRSRERASEKVKATLEAKRNSNTIMGPNANPFKNLPVITKTPQKHDNKQKKSVSVQV